MVGAMAKLVQEGKTRRLARHAPCRAQPVYPADRRTDADPKLLGRLVARQPATLCLVLARSTAAKKSTTKCRRRDFVVTGDERTRTFVSAACGSKKCPPVGGKKPKVKNYCEINMLAGWGARIRTWEWRNQKSAASKLVIAHPWRLSGQSGILRSSYLSSSSCTVADGTDGCPAAHLR